MTRCINPVSRDTALRLLGNETRREIIRVLKNSEEEAWTIDGLATSIARGSERQDVAIRLHHVHIPMLADANFVEFNPISGRVVYTGDEMVETLFESLELLRSEESDE